MSDTPLGERGCTFNELLHQNAILFDNKIDFAAYRVVPATFLPELDGDFENTVYAPIQDSLPAAMILIIKFVVRYITVCVRPWNSKNAVMNIIPVEAICAEDRIGPNLGAFRTFRSSTKYSRWETANPLAPIHFLVFEDK
jgi:hypothetical protein